MISMIKMLVVDVNHEEMTIHGCGRVDKDVAYYAAFCPPIKESKINERDVKIKTWTGQFNGGWCWRCYTLSNPGFINTQGVWVVHKLEGKKCTEELVYDFLYGFINGGVFGVNILPSDIKRIIYTDFGFGINIEVNSEEFDRYIETNGKYIDFSHLQGKRYEYPAILPDDQCTPEDYERGYCFMV
jgi:hypothetical protein